MDRCKGCRCRKCRWRGAGSLCHYNEYGADSSRCSWCYMAISTRGPELGQWKTESYMCKGFERCVSDGH